MELRRTINLPKRYEQDPRDSPDEEQYMTSASKSAPSPVSPAFKPNLPPAAFPTLDAAQVALSPSTPNSKLSEAQQRSAYSQITQHSHHHSEHHRFEDQSSAVMPSTSTSSRKMNGIFPAKMPSSMISSDESDPNLETSNSLQNPIYRQNMETMESIGRRSSHDWNMLEMETSDEDDIFETAFISKPILIGRDKISPNKGKSVEWEEVSVAHQVQILRALLEIGHTEEGAMERLGLNTCERQELVKNQLQYQQRIAAEDHQLELLRSSVHQKLLEGGGTRPAKFSQTMYRNCFDGYLGDFLHGKAEDFDLTTVSDLGKAQSFLTIKGLDISLGDCWGRNHEYSISGKDMRSLQSSKTQVRSLSSTRAVNSVESAEGGGRGSHSATMNSVSGTAAGISSNSSRSPPAVKRKRPLPLTISTVDTQLGSETQSSDLTKHANAVDLITGSVDFDKPGEKRRRILPLTSPRKKKVETKASSNERLDLSNRVAVKSSLKRTLSGSVSNVSSTQSHVQNSRSDSSARKNVSREGTLLSEATSDDGPNIVPIKRLNGLSINTSDDAGLFSSRDTPPSGPTTPIQALSHSSMYRGLRSPSARRLPSRYSETSLDQGSDESLKGSSNKKQVQKKRSNLSMTTDSNALETKEKKRSEKH